MVNIADYHLWAIWPPPRPRLFKDSEMPAWLGLIRMADELKNEDDYMLWFLLIVL